MGAAREGRCATGGQPSAESGSTAADTAARGGRWPCLTVPSWTAPGLFAIPAIVVFGLSHPVPAQPFDALAFLQDVCFRNVTFGSNLKQLCQHSIENTPSGGVSAAPATGQAAAGVGPAIERRLQAVRESKELMKEAGATEVMYASYPGEAVLADNGQLQLPPAGGAPSESVVVSTAQGLSLFASAGAVALRHHNNSFEDGYDALLPTVTVGTDYWFIPGRLLGGAAFNYTRSDGDYDHGGDFNKDIYSPVLYATFLPFDCTPSPGASSSPCAFINAVLSYSRNENSNNRKLFIANPDPAFEFTGHTSADYPENQYSAALQAGYDHPLGDFTIGPRLGFAYSHSQIDSFEEHGNTGDEMRYSGLDQTSVQTSLGAAATVAIAIPHGTLWPQLSAAWVHEYANDARNIDARFVEASPSPTFTFQREKPARDWATIGLGVSTYFDNGMQPFAQFTTVQGNENFTSYGGTAGLRYSF
jgi:uncharacterized protein YhjY with autotransporter beta-barrel domain